MSSAAYAQPEQDAAGAVELFVHRAHRDGRPVVILRGVALGAEVVVEAEVYPTESGGAGSVLRRPYRFPTREQALRFVDETLAALEYLNCAVA